jgi:hypothetical protein
MRNLVVMSISAVLLRGCIVRAFTEGTMINGRIEPCAGNHLDSQACGNALFNAKRLPKIALGMSKDDVLRIMEHSAERQEARLDSGVAIEAWAYMQDYGAETMTAIVFTDGRVTGIRTVPWQSDVSLIVTSRASD